MQQGYLFGGSDEFEIKSAAKKMVASLQEFVSNAELEIIEGSPNGEDVTVSACWDVVTTLQTPSLFMTPKIVWFKDLVFAIASDSNEYEKPKATKKKTTKRDDKDPLQPLINLLKEGIPEQTYLVINGIGIDKRKLFYKACESAHLELDWIDKLDPKDKKYNHLLETKIRRALKEADVLATEDAINCLKEILNADSGRIYTEISKLAAYSGGFGSKITRKDCLEVCSCTPEAVGWAFSEALVSGDLSEALRAIDELISQMEAQKTTHHELTILASVSKAFQDMVGAYSALDELGVDPHNVHPKTFERFADQKSQFPTNILLNMHPFRAFKIVENLKRFPTYRLVEILSWILDTNKQLVSTASDHPQIALERLAMKIIQSPENPR